MSHTTITQDRGCITNSSYIQHNFNNIDMYRGTLAVSRLVQQFNLKHQRTHSWHSAQHAAYPHSEDEQ